jgi:2-polyprenyl-6-methoxyphenol hydroxylase-like FAD-dependent oxidoreductase
MSRQVIVIGGSMSGLFAALFLRKAGWEVDIFERVDVELSARGAGIVSHPEMIDSLTALGIHYGETLGVQIQERRTLGRNGGLLGTYRCPQITTSWNRLYQILRGAFPDRHFHAGKEFVSCDNEANGVTAHFADGSSVTGDLLIAADGFRSTVRGRLLPDMVPQYAGYVAWRGMVEEHALSAATHRDLFAYFAFCLPPGEQMLGYPVAGSNDDLRPDHRRYNFVWYQPADAEHVLPHLLTDRNGHTHALSIPPPAIDPAVIAQMRKHAQAVLAPQFGELVSITSDPFLQPIYDIECSRLVVNRVAFVGDAAFTARPHVGAGVSKAADDGRMFAKSLAEAPDIRSGLARFESARLSAGRRIVEAARRLGSSLQPNFSSESERKQAQRHHTPKAAMEETALLDFVRRMPESAASGH